MPLLVHFFTKNSYWVHAFSTIINPGKTTGRKANLVHTVLEHRLVESFEWSPKSISFFTLCGKKIQKPKKLPCPYEESHIVVIPDVLTWLWKLYLVYLNDSFIHSAEWHSLLPVSNRSVSTRPQELNFHGERTDTMIHFKNICALIM